MCERFDDYPDILDIQDMKEMLSVGRNTAYNLCRKGALPCRKAGGKWKIAKVAVQQFLVNNEDLLLHCMLSGK